MKRFLIAATAVLTMVVAPAAMARPHDGPARSDHGRTYSIERHGGYGQGGGYGYNQHDGYRASGHNRYAQNRNYGYQGHDRGYRNAPRQHGGNFNNRH